MPHANAAQGGGFAGSLAQINLSQRSAGGPNSPRAKNENLISRIRRMELWRASRKWPLPYIVAVSYFAFTAGSHFSRFRDFSAMEDPQCTDQQHNGLIPIQGLYCELLAPLGLSGTS
jgi:hypothetical protein